MRRDRGNYIFFGDFNVVREADERFGFVFYPISAQSFNEFIDDVGLIDVHMVGKWFTRVDVICAKPSKLDWFLVSIAVSDHIDHLQVLVLDRKWSNHCPILLQSNTVEFGPSLFKFFNS